MQTQSEVESVVRDVYKSIAGDPSELVIQPMDGTWDNALSYKVTRADGKRTWVYRSDLDDENREGIAESLRNFKLPTKPDSSS